MTMTDKQQKRSGWIALSVLAALLAVALMLWTQSFSEGVTVAEPGLDASFDLPINIRSADAFTKDANGYISYPGAKCGIDVSAHQMEIDWQRVRASGVEFAIIRAGYRGYGAGTLQEDEYFRANLAGAKEAGLDVGVYFFSQAISAQEAVEEAEYVLSLLDGAELELPVFFDWEEVGDDGSRTAGIESYLVGDCAFAFCRRIEQAGYTGGVYFNQRYGYTIMQLELLQPYSFWLAEYRNAPSFLYDFRFWQYTGEGRVDGIDTVVDLDLLFTDGGQEGAE